MAAIPLDLLDRIRELERQVRSLMGSANTRPALDEIIGGRVVIGQGGSLQVLDTDGSSIFYVGQVGPDHPDGTAQQGMLLRREDGTLAFGVYTTDHVNNRVQAIRMFDVKGNVVVADDTKDHGLARPFLTYPLPTTEDVGKWDNTNKTTWTTLYRGNALTQHPKLYAYIAATTGGEVRLLVNGNQVGPTAKGALEFTAPIGVPFDSRIEFQVQAKANANSTIWVSPRALYGVQS
ncbi:hypothetical protein [Streptomyces albireticuli]|uniref:hypothetical protein n=1 Tax=Streptomyces albireticuli TaxID=1940 RepID=UPI0036A2A3B2